MSRRAEWMWVLSACLLLNVIYAGTQTVDHLNTAFGDGGREYHAMAASALRGHPLQEAAPFVHRPGMPIMVATLADHLGWVIRTGFFRLSVAFNLLSVVLLTVLLQRHVPGVAARLIVIVAFMIEPHSPMRLSYYHPVAVDAAALACLLGGLVGLEWFQDRAVASRAAVLSVVVAAGVAFHEVALLVPLCLLLVPLAGATGARARPAGWRNQWAALEASGAWLPLLTGIAAWLAIRAWVVALPEPSAPAGWLRGLQDKSPMQYAAAWFLVFGPLLALPIVFARRTAEFLRQRPSLLVYVSALAVLAWVRAGDAEHVLVFASPVVWVVIAHALSGMAIGRVSAPVVGLLVAQALWARLFSPLGMRDVLLETWGRLGWPPAAAAFSYANMWSRSAASSLVNLYVLGFGAMTVVVYTLVGKRSPRHEVVEAALAPRWPNPIGAGFTGVVERVPAAILIAAGTLAAMAPIVWLASSRFYWTQFAQPGYGYLVYNLARLWMLVILLGAFWATGSRIMSASQRSRNHAGHRPSRFIEPAVCGAAAWSVVVVLLAALHLYYLWAILPLVALAVGLALSDGLAMWRRASAGPEGAPVTGRWGLAGSLLTFIVVFNAAALLLTIALWGNPGPDNDVPGNYLPYYESVLQAHSIAPDGYWVHYFVSKGNGLAFMVNVLSDVQGSALASFLVLLLGGAMIWRLAAHSAARSIGVVGLCLYLQFHAEQGAYAKGHIIRNTLIACLVLSFTRFIAFEGREARLHAVGRVVVITAVLFLSPLAVVLLVPIFLFETALVALLRNAAEAKRHLLFTAWALGATALVCLYNFFQSGLPELHSMPSFVGQFVDIDRLSRWMDPGLAYVDDRLAFIQRSLPGGADAGVTAVGIAPTQSYWQGLQGMLNPAALTLIGGAIGAVLMGLVFSRWSAGSVSHSAGAGTRGGSDAREYAPALGAAYLTAILLLLAGLRMFGGGPGSSMARFTDFIIPLAIALGVLLLTMAWTMAMSRFHRGVMTVAMAGVSAAAIYLGSAPVLAQSWRPSIGFFAGESSYAAMFDGNWDTEAARRLAVSLPDNERVEVVNFLPGFTAIPATPFQRPDGNVYLEDYTRVLYGSEDEVAAVYAAASVNYFLFDVSGQSPLVWSGFSPLFSPESIRSRMRLVTHTVSGRGDLYLLTWNRTNVADSAEPFETFLQKWRDLLEAERRNGIYRRSYESGARRLGRGLTSARGPAAVSYRRMSDPP